MTIDDLRSIFRMGGENDIRHINGRREKGFLTHQVFRKKNVWRISLLDKQRDSKFHCVCADQADLQHKQNLEHFCAACTTEFWLKSGKEARIQLTFWPKSGKIREREPRRPKIWRKFTRKKKKFGGSVETQHTFFTMGSTAFSISLILFLRTRIFFTCSYDRSSSR